MGWGSYFSDLLALQQALAWMTHNPDWKMVVVYLAQYDMTGNCPVCKEGAAYREDKHHSLLEVDRYAWTLRRFLEENRWWDRWLEETFLFIGSDHGCHYGCTVSIEEGRKRGIPEGELSNYCSNHQLPHDCRAWDFGENAPSGAQLDCCRRITFIAAGGALPSRHRGRKLSSGEIIDFVPTLAGLMGIPFETEGKNLLY